MKPKEILIYAGTDGSEYRGTHTEKHRTEFKKQYKRKGYIGYLSGYRYDAYGMVSVIAFFKEKPTSAEIQKRRDNGFKMAKWNWL